MGISAVNASDKPYFMSLFHIYLQVIIEVPEHTGLKESKAARRLYGKVNKLITQIEPVIGALNVKTEEMQKLVDAGDAAQK